MDAALAPALRGWLDAGVAHAALELAARHPDAPLPDSLSFARSLARVFLGAAALDAATAPSEAFLQLAAACPPMRGAECCTREALISHWEELARALAQALSASGQRLEAWLDERRAAWHAAGRVCFHLAENRRDAERPFAFLATYVEGDVATDKAKHKPLSAALAQYAGANATRDLLALLGPVQRAAEASPLARTLLDTRAIFQPQRWTAGEAHAFLRDVPAFEAAGVVVRVPDWWKARAPSRVTVQVTLGATSPGALGAEGLLSFDAALALDGEPLTAAEWKALASDSSGLVSLRGRWVELDRARLEAALAQWRTAQASARDGVPFHEAMRLLAGVSTVARDDDEAEDGREWTRVAPGAWLAKTLETLRSPGAVASSLPRTLTAELRPYQADGVRWLVLLNELGLGACLADDMGLGKTIQVLALMLVLKERSRPRAPHLLVVPATLLGNWQSEAARFAPTLRFAVAHPSAAGALEAGAALRDGADVVLTTYAMLQRLKWLADERWDTVILDEAQAIKNAGTRQSRSARTLDARVRLALTGTPVENRAGDLWSLFDFLQPKLLGTAKDFQALAKRAAERPEGWAPVRSLVAPYLLRRLKTDRSVIADLPEKTAMLAECGLSREQVALYLRAVDDLRARLAKTPKTDGVERRGAVLASLVRLKQICNHPSQWLGDNGWEPERSAKLQRVAELVEPIRERQEKVLVFTQFREAVEPLAAFLAREFGHDGLVLHGGTSVAKRRELVETFQSDDAVPFFVLSLKAGGTGLNLTAASHVVHFDRWWNPAVEDQATDRAFRIGQRRNVFVHALTCRGTVEERVDAMIAGKRKLAGELLGGGGEIPLTELDDDALLALVQLDARRAAAE